jgi:hypothetical protein
MATVKAFGALRFTDVSGDISKNVCPPYDIISEEERLGYISDSGNNIIRLEKPVGEDAYTKAQKLYLEWRDKGILSNDEKAKVTNYSKLSGILSGVETDKIIHNFGVNGKESDFFNITGNLSNASKYGVPLTYNGLTIEKCLKLESSTSITFELETTMTLTLVFSTYTYATIKIDGTGYDSSAEQFETHDGYITFTIELEAGSHTIGKKDSQVIFYMSLE